MGEEHVVGLGLVAEHLEFADNPERIGHVDEAGEWPDGLVHPSTF
jgi:hypothetical protein